MDQDQLSELYKIVFFTDPGRAVLDDICSMCGITDLSYNPNDSSRDIMLFYEGKKSIAFYILEHLNKRTNNYIKTKITGDENVHSSESTG